jgi:hypothetical protein
MKNITEGEIKEHSEDIEKKNKKKCWNSLC